MKRTDYTALCEVLKKLKELGMDVDNTTIPLQDKSEIISPLSETVDKLNLYLAKNRQALEKRVYKKTGTFSDFIKEIFG